MDTFLVAKCTQIYNVVEMGRAFGEWRVCFP